MGAEIIKIETMTGDPFRYADSARHRGMGAPFLNLNRNKRSIVLNLKGDKDRDLLTRLLDEADVFVSNARPQALRNLQLDAQTVLSERPRLIYCSLYGFSESGPYAGRAAIDDVIQAMSGLAWLQGHNEGTPCYLNTIIADKATGLAAVGAISMALFERERSGQGQSIEIPMFEFMVSFNLVEHLSGATFLPASEKPGYERVLSPSRKPYRTSDGYISVTPYTTEHWQRFFDAIDRHDLANDPLLVDPAARSRTINVWYRVLAETLLQRTTDDWMQLAARIDIPFAKVRTLDEILHDEHLRMAGLFREDNHPSEGKIVTVGIPIKFSRTPGEIRRLAPRLNEHNEEIRRGLRKRNVRTSR